MVNCVITEYKIVNEFPLVVHLTNSKDKHFGLFCSGTKEQVTGRFTIVVEEDKYYFCFENSKYYSAHYCLIDPEKLSDISLKLSSFLITNTIEKGYMYYLNASKMLYYRSEDGFTYKEYNSIEDVIKFKLDNGFEPSKEDLRVKEQVENQKLVKEQKEQLEAQAQKIKELELALEQMKKSIISPEEFQSLKQIATKLSIDVAPTVESGSSVTSKKEEEKEP
jgi:hypothetical protein